MNEIRGEVDHCRHRLDKYCHGQGLDLGCGRSKISLNAIGVDLHSPEADMHIDARDLSRYPDNHFDFIFSSHLLEELGNTEATLRDWVRVVKDGGNIVLYQADKNTYYPIGHPQCNTSHRHHFDHKDLWAVFEKIGGVQLVHASDPVNKEWSFELVVRKTKDPIIMIKAVKPPIKIMVVGGPVEGYIERCLSSISAQTYSDWSAQVILDPVGDDSYNKAKKFESDKIKIKLNDARQYNVANFLEASKLLNPSDDDVMVMVDGDDWLASPDSLSILASKYEKNPELLLTHGSWLCYPQACLTNNYAYRPEEFELGVRKVGWRASHLRTCKYKIWKRIKDEDLRDQSGKYFSVTGDLALMMPLLEMAGYDRIEFIPEMLYVYNQETPHNDAKERLMDQMTTDGYIRSKASYQRVESF